ncbi:MAG TPA: hypothetical protein VM264_04955 [Acidimicrobiales bacterium]|nr:hypothetical protein [Acidimicrobiales bacterium]
MVRTVRVPSLAVPAAALAAGILLGAGLAGVAVHEPARAATTGTVSDAGPRRAGGTADGVRAVLPGLVAFVEDARGLEFRREVDVELLDDDAFQERLGSSDDEARKEIEDAQAVLQAMGLVAPGLDLVAAVDRFAGEAVLGFYDAETDELVVRGMAATPLVRTTLVHELVHALEDQHFDLDRPDLGDEEAAAFQALAEGSAAVVEERYVDSLSPSERRAAEGAELARGRALPGDVPEVVQIAFGFPYVFGPDLVRALLEAGGQERLDQAFAEPPRSTEHVLEPARYLAGDDPRPVRQPPADRPAFDDGEIGALFLILMLRAELTDRQAGEAAQGWGGDRYVAWRDGERACVRMSFVMDTPRDADELEDALADWAAERPRSASASGLSLRTCG